MVRTAKYMLKRSLHDGQVLSDMATTNALERCEPNCEAAARPASGPEEFRHVYGHKVLGVDELAEFFQCSTEKIKRLARKGELPAFKFGKTWFVCEQGLEAYITRAAGSKLDSWKR